MNVFCCLWFVYRCMLFSKISDLRVWRIFLSSIFVYFNLLFIQYFLIALKHKPGIWCTEFQSHVVLKAFLHLIHLCYLQKNAIFCFCILETCYLFKIQRLIHSSWLNHRLYFHRPFRPSFEIPVLLPPMIVFGWMEGGCFIRRVFWGLHLGRSTLLTTISWITSE